MKVKLTKDWASFKKGQEIELLDQSVILKGLEIGLFEKESKKVK